METESIRPLNFVDNYLDNSDKLLTNEDFMKNPAVSNHKTNANSGIGRGMEAWVTGG